MSEKRTTARAFHDAVGVEDWRVLFSGAHAYFHVGSFAEAARFVAAIADVAEAVGHFPDVDVRPEGVTVRTASGEYGALSQRDVELARRISAEARTLGIEPDPSQVQVVGHRGGTGCRQRRRSVLGRGPRIPEPWTERRRRRSAPAKPTRVVSAPPPSQAGAWPDPHRRQRAGRSGRSRVAAALEAGGRLADGTHAPHWWTLASPENHGVDIAAWPDFEDDEDD